MKQKIQKGFTLIELLIVIAIIGILAGVLYVNINPTTQIAKANDAELKANMGAVRLLAFEIFNESDFNYENVETDTKITAIVQTFVNGQVTSSERAWAVKGQLENGNYFCRDSVNKTSEQTIQDITDHQCD